MFLQTSRVACIYWFLMSLSQQREATKWEADSWEISWFNLHLWTRNRKFLCFMHKQIFFSESFFCTVENGQHLQKGMRNFLFFFVAMDVLWNSFNVYNRYRFYFFILFWITLSFLPGVKYELSSC